MLNNFYSSNYWWVQWTVLFSSIKTLQSHQIINGITDYFTKYGVFFIKMLTWPKSHEKLRFIVIFSSISHSNDTSPCEFKSLMKLIPERSTINRLSTHTCTSRVTTLDHESRDKSMKYSIDVISVDTMLNEVFRC